jgi:hypothetical protein
MDDLTTRLDQAARLREPAFTSGAPVIGPLIVRARRAWNWMSTKWYVRPVLDQQSQFNALTVEALKRVNCAVGGLEQYEVLPSAAFPNGHYYSPVVDVAAAKVDEARIWPAQPNLLGLDFNDAEQRRVLAEDFGRYIGDFDYPDEPPPGAPGYQYYANNASFTGLDSRALFVMLRRLRPARMIEVGSGYSSFLTSDVNRRFLGEALDLTCVEPYPSPALLAGVPGIGRLVRQKVQDVPLSMFADLNAGDILFIDSSHVSKTGSDVNHLLFEVVPRLRAGVIIHWHDVFLPDDYPPKWVLENGRSWNEEYLVRALLMFSDAFEVMFSSSYACRRLSEEVRAALGGQSYWGGSLWVRKTR